VRLTLCYENPLHMLEPCGRDDPAMAALADLPAALAADGAAADVYGNVQRRTALVLCAARQVPDRLTRDEARRIAVNIAKLSRSAAVGHSLLIDGSNYFCFVVLLDFI
jgi:hypothetical protein